MVGSSSRAHPSTDREFTVIIPACNEARSLPTLLTELLKGAETDALDVIVAANGCTDETAEIARAYGPPVRVVEIAQSSKPRALNAAEALEPGFPRLYTDADARFSYRDLAAIADALREPGVLAASCRLEIDARLSSWPVRSYMKIWKRLPSTRNGLGGRGLYAMNAVGRARFGPFPDTLVDDRFVHDTFSESERRVVASVVSVVPAPRDLRSLLRRKIRVHQGLDELRTEHGGAGTNQLAWLAAILERPSLALHAPVYVAISLISKLIARRRGRTGDRRWGRDDSTRLG